MGCQGTSLSARTSILRRRVSSTKRSIKSISRKTSEPDSRILSLMRSRWAGISVQCRPAVVMAEVVTLVHEIHFVIDGDGVGEVILGALRVVKSVLDPGGHGHDEIHDEKGNQDVGNADSPVVNKNRR